MDLINLAHASFYMLGAFFGASITLATGSFTLGFAGAIVAVLIVAWLVERGIIAHLYTRDHLDQLLATFGLILIADTLVHMVWGPAGMAIALPSVLQGQVSFGSVTLPSYRILIIGVGLLVADSRRCI